MSLMSLMLLEFLMSLVSLMSLTARINDVIRIGTVCSSPSD